MARRGKSNHVWTIEEDAKLVESIVELKRSKNWDGESGSGLRKGYQKELEKILQEKLPGNGLKEKPHIESRCKLLKKQYHAIYDVRANGELSGFGWDDERKCVTASADVWDDYLKVKIFIFLIPFLFICCMTKYYNEIVLLCVEPSRLYFHEKQVFPLL